MHNFLEGFEKRMEIVAIVESIVNRKNKNMEIERWFNEHEFTNLVFSVLLFIMEKTLAEDSNCDSDHIQEFISSVLPSFRLTLDNVQLEEMTRYIIKTVLQNEGVPHYFNSIDYSKGEIRRISIRLITDQVKEVDGTYQITYALTDQGYDFLFRTKEVDQEIQMTIEELKLKELIKRKNFTKALGQSQNLIQLVRQKKQEIEHFLMKIKENIHDIDIVDFEKLMNSTYELLQDEYKLLSDIMGMASSAEEKIRKEFEENSKLDDSLKKAQGEIKKIHYNIKATLSEQKDLILSRQSLSALYIELIGDSFHYSMEKRFDLEELILKPMEQHVGSVEHFWKLLNPLLLPNLNKHLNPVSLYAPQGLLKAANEQKENAIETEDFAEDAEQQKAEELSDLYVEIMDYIFLHVLENEGDISFLELLDLLEKDEERFSRFVQGHVLYTTVLKLYDIGPIDIHAWQHEQERMVVNLSEEFNLEYCLDRLLVEGSAYQQLLSLELSKIPGSPIEVSRNTEEGFIEKIEVSNFRIKAEISNEQHENSDTNIQSLVGERSIGSGNR